MMVKVVISQNLGFHVSECFGKACSVSRSSSAITGTRLTISLSRGSFHCSAAGSQGSGAFIASVTAPGSL